MSDMAAAASNDGILLPQHEKLIQESAISPEVKAARGYKSITDPTKLRPLSFEQKQSRVPGLLIPIYSTRGEVVLHQYRPDDPRKQKRKGVVRSIKYETPTGAAMRLDVPPAVRPRLGLNSWLLVTEGSRKADAAISHGIDSIGLLGVWNWRGKNHNGMSTALPDWEDIALRGRTVCIGFDSDVMLKPETYKALTRLWSFLANRGADVCALYLPHGEDGKKVGIDDYFAAGGTTGELISRYVEHALRPLARPGDRPRVCVNGGDLDHLSKEAWESIQKANDPPVLFRYGGGIARIERDESKAPVIRIVDFVTLRREAVHLIEFVKETEEEGEKPSRPPRDLIENLIGWPEPPLPVITRIVHAPVFAPDGSILLEPGYHEQARVYFHKGTLELPSVPEEPSRADCDNARALLLDELLGDFPFVGSADRAHVLAFALLPFARDMIAGPTPLHLVEKPSPGTGAGLLIDAISIVTTGRPAAAMTEGTDEDEWRKRITAALSMGPAILLVDNLRRRLDSAALSSALTCDSWTDRLLGRTKMLRLSVRCAWVAAGNNPATSTEIARRSVPIRLDARQDRPWERGDFRHPALALWARQHRGRLVAAALTLIRAWVAAGRPSWSGRPFGSFEEWSSTMGGILNVAGVDGFLGNLPEFYERADREGEAWRVFISAWWERYQDREVGVAELWEIVSQGDGLLDLGHGSERSMRTRLGHELHRARDRRFGRFHVELSRSIHKVAKYRLSQQEAGDPQGPPDPSPAASPQDAEGEPGVPCVPGVPVPAGLTRAHARACGCDVVGGKGTPGTQGTPRSPDPDWDPELCPDRSASVAAGFEEAKRRFGIAGNGGSAR